jgi:hypothetical protein
LNYAEGGAISKNGEMRVLQKISRFFSNTPRIIVFDIGANVGLYSTLMSEIFGDKATIYSFEPSPCF